MRLIPALPITAAAALIAGSAHAQSVEAGGRGLKIAAVFNDAGPEAKLVVLGLVACGLTAAALGPWLARQAERHAAPRGLGFLSGLRVGGPLIALMAIFYNALNSFVGRVWYDRAPTDVQLAQGYAELTLFAVAGTFVAIAAVFSLEHVRAALNRARG